MPTELNQEVVDEVRDFVATNMEAAAGMVEMDARRRMLAIVELAFGRAYRRLLALGKLISRVVVEGDVVEEDVVEGQIGIPVGDAGGDYGFCIEVGSKAKAAQPWLRPALMQNFKEILRLLTGG